MAGRTDSIITDFLPDETRIAFEGQEHLCDQLVSASLVPARSCYLEFGAFELSGVQDLEVGPWLKRDQHQEQETIIPPPLQSLNAELS